jgi:hypothetical protein
MARSRVLLPWALVALAFAPASARADDVPTDVTPEQYLEWARTYLADTEKAATRLGQWNGPSVKELAQRYLKIQRIAERVHDPELERKCRLEYARLLASDGVELPAAPASPGKRTRALAGALRELGRNDLPVDGAAAALLAIRAAIDDGSPIEEPTRAEIEERALRWLATKDVGAEVEDLAVSVLERTATQKAAVAVVAREPHRARVLAAAAIRLGPNDFAPLARALATSSSVPDDVFDAGLSALARLAPNGVSDDSLREPLRTLGGPRRESYLARVLVPVARPELAPEVDAALSATSPALRADALAALGRVLGPAGLAPRMPHVLACLDDPEAGVRTWGLWVHVQLARADVARATSALATAVAARPEASELTRESVLALAAVTPEGGLELAENSWPRLTPTQRTSLTKAVLEQADPLAELLGDLVLRAFGEKRAYTPQKRAPSADEVRASLDFFLARFASIDTPGRAFLLAEATNRAHASALDVARRALEDPDADVRARAKELVTAAETRLARENRPFLGVGVATPAEGEKWVGAKITSIVPGTAAEGSGLEVGDVLEVFNGTRLARSGHLRELIERLKVGTRVTLTFLRPSTNERQELTVELGKRPPGQE